MLSVEEIGSMTGRTESAIQMAASRFGLPKRMGITEEAAQSALSEGKLRPCMACGRNFWSKGKFNPLCGRCKLDESGAEAAQVLVFKVSSLMFSLTR